MRIEKLYPQLRFYVGKVDGEFKDWGWKNKQNMGFKWKLPALKRAKSILNRDGQVYFKVLYGKFKDCWNEKSNFYNDGIYNNFKDLDEILKMWIEPLLLKSLYGEVA